jgi:hypothetical protein
MKGIFLFLAIVGFSSARAAVTCQSGYTMVTDANYTLGSSCGSGYTEFTDQNMLPVLDDGSDTKGAFTGNVCQVS